MSGRQTDRIEQMTPESRRFPANMSFVGKEAYCFSADILPTGAEPPRNLGKNQLAELLDKLSDRDFEILISLKYAKYLLTGQIKRLHFSESPKPQVGMHYCKKMDEYLVEKMNHSKPKTFAHLENIWYSGYSGNRNGHYHNSRYHFLNLHCFFHGNHTIELRGFNSELHAGKIRAYIVFALAMNHQALTQKSASYRKVQEENEKFAMRVYLNRIGFIGDEFKSCRKHLYEHLDGNAAWRYGSKENCHSRRKKAKDTEETVEEDIPVDEAIDLDDADIPFP